VGRKPVRASRSAIATGPRKRTGEPPECVQALAESEDRLRLVLEIAGDGIWEWNIVTGEVWLSPRWLETWGYPPGDVEPTIDSWRDLVHPDDLPRVVGSLERHIAGGTPLYEEEYRLRTRSGTYRWNRSRGRLLGRDARGRPQRMVGIDADITVRKEWDEASARGAQIYQQLFDHMNEGFGLHEVICDDQGRPCDYRFLDVNGKFEELTGLKADDVLGRTVREVLPGIDSYWIEELGQVALTGRPARLEEYSTPLGRYYRVSAFCPMKGRFACVFTDVTDHKRLVESLRESQARFLALNAELEHQVMQRTDALNLANQELEAFSYSVSHDLRAPVRHLTGFVKLLERHAGAALDDKGRRYLGIIADSARRMGRLIDDLLEFSQTGRAELHTTTVDLQSLVDDVRLECLDGLEGPPVVWKVSPLPQVRADRSLLRQALVNLVSNALKFTRTRERAVIEIGEAPSDDGTAVIFVRDNGVGFDARYVEKLFGVFQRLHSSEEFEGTGIGLANVKRIVERHGGRVWAEGAVGRGATLYVALPKAEERGS